MAQLVATASSVKCRLCKSGERRAEVDEWIGRLGEDEGGRPITLDRLASEILPLLLGEAMSVSAIKRHRSNHCRPAEGGGREPSEPAVPDWETDPEWQAVLAEVEAMSALGEIPPTALLQLHAKLHVLSLRRQMREGREIKLTIDQGARTAEKLLSGARSAAEETLLGMLAGGISSVFERQLSAQPVPAAIDAPIEAEVVAEEVDDAAE